MFVLVHSLALAQPVVDPPRGVYDAPQLVVVTPVTPGATAMCGLGGAPATPCGATVEIASTTTLDAFERLADGSFGPWAVHTYVFPASVVAGLDPTVVGDAAKAAAIDRTLRTLPTLAIRHGTQVVGSEIPVIFEWIDPAGDDLQIECGANLTGGTSPAYAKDSYRLHFRSEYGASKLSWDVWPDEPGLPAAEELDALSLRSHNHDSVFYLGEQGQYLRTPFMDETHLTMGHLAPHGRPAHVYLDGSYWGTYHVREHFSAAFMASYLGGDEDDFEAVNGGVIEDGSGVGWARVVASGSSWEAFSEAVDEAQFLDYMIFNFYAANAWDWSPDHNWQAAGPTGAEPRDGQWVFHSSDNDICLYYDATTDITGNPGPQSLFQTLRQEGHPDFWSLLSDRMHALFAPGRPLAADVARARYAALAAESEDAVVAESGRWGASWWDRDTHWIPERDRLLDDWFPVRSAALVGQVRANGWYPFDGPTFSVPAGEVSTGTRVAATPPEGLELWYTVDGQDPRRSRGTVHLGAIGPVARVDLEVTRSLDLFVRVRSGDAWGPGERVRYEVDARPPIALNEWNAVAPDAWLDDDGADDALGRVIGNGGDWIELLILEDGTDVRGWTLEMTDRRGPAGALTLLAAPALADLRAGTLLTVAEDLPQDLDLAPEDGDWRIHLQAGVTGPATAVSAEAFDVTHLDWTLTVRDAAGAPVLGPVGEGVSPASGLNSKEVGLLADTPGDGYRRDDGDYEDGTHSTFGAPNVWSGGAQDLDALRGIEHEPLDTSWTAPDTAGPDSEVPPTETRDSSPGSDAAAPHESAEDLQPPDPAGCGCTHGGRPPVALFPLGWLWMRRRSLGLGLAVGCAGPAADSSPRSEASPPGTTPTGESGPEETGPAREETGPDVVTPEACWRDADGDGRGDPAVEVSCDDPGATPEHSDCDDRDNTVYPGAPEVCDGVDDDCDGSVDDDPVDGLPFYRDSDGDGFGSDTIVGACLYGDGLALVSGDCDDADPEVHPGAEESCDAVDVDCDGVAGGLPGAGAGCAAVSCAEALAVRGEADDGVYWLERAAGPTPIWCDMTTEGGGWTLGLVRCSSDAVDVVGFGAAERDVDALALGAAGASASAGACTGWLDLNAEPWVELMVTAAAAGATTYTSRVIPRGEIRIPFGSNGYYLFGGSTGYYWCAGAASYTDAGIGAVDNPPGATLDCKGHGSLGSGWDFSEQDYGNAGLTQCGPDGSNWIYAGWATQLTYLGSPGGAHALWVR